MTRLIRTFAFALFLTMSLGTVALGYTFSGPYLDNVWGQLYTHQPRFCDGGGPWVDGTNTGFCYNLYDEDTPSQDLNILTWIRWNVNTPVVYWSDNPELWWGITWIVDYTNGNNTLEYFDFMCAPFTESLATPYYYKQTSGGTQTRYNSIEQYVYDSGECPGGGVNDHSFYEELESRTH